MKAKIALTLSLILTVAAPLFSNNNSSPDSARNSNERITPEEATAIGSAAYIYGYPLVWMEINRRVMTNVTQPDGVKAPMGQFTHTKQYPKASFKHVRAPDTDILPSTAWIDVSKEPYILHLPPIKSRYYLFPLLSGWTEIFASISPRTISAGTSSYAITGPGWEGFLPKGVREIKSPTGTVWITGRTFCTGCADDYKAVHAIQHLYTLTPLSAYGQPGSPQHTVDPSIDMKTPVHEQVRAMDVEAFFNLMASVMENNPSASEDHAILSEMVKIGLVPGKTFSLAEFDEAVVNSLKGIPQIVHEQFSAHAVAAKGKLMNGWCLISQANDEDVYLQRALTAFMGVRTALPEDALYLYTPVDLGGELLEGSKQYIVHFPKGQTPPVRGFWSLAVYNRRYHLIPNALNRYSLSPEDLMKYNFDGSLDIYVQNKSPGPNKESNWLPSPSDAFVLMLRLYWPKEEVLNGNWVPPSVTVESF